MYLVEDSVVEKWLAETGHSQSRFNVQIPAFDKAENNNIDHKHRYVAESTLWMISH